MLLNTEKGKELFQFSNKFLEIKKSELSNCMQPNLISPSKPSTKRIEFWNHYNDKGIEYAIHKYVKPQCFKDLIKKTLWICKIRNKP